MHVYTHMYKLEFLSSVLIRTRYSSLTHSSVCKKLEKTKNKIRAHCVPVHCNYCTGISITLLWISYPSVSLFDFISPQGAHYFLLLIYLFQLNLPVDEIKYDFWRVFVNNRLIWIKIQGITKFSLTCVSRVHLWYYFV